MFKKMPLKMYKREKKKKEERKSKRKHTAKKLLIYDTSNFITGIYKECINKQHFNHVKIVMLLLICYMVFTSWQRIEYFSIKLKVI